ncbi:MAG: hypothetical protein JW714_03420 [Candidatus Omnitrophica bacterium]|nr:hypothetical protein [Candidatus Omnitrophota bacterium]
MTKLKLFYRITVTIALLLILTHSAVKASIWFVAPQERHDEIHKYAIGIRKNAPGERYTTESRQKLFNAVNYLLAPAFTLLFTVLAVKLIKTEGIFELEG